MLCAIYDVGRTGLFLSRVARPVLTCELLDRLQPHADGLVAEQRRGGQRARHALHNANVLQTLGHGERGRGVVRLKGTVAVYAATCRME